jgi:hypothetical protein
MLILLSEEFIKFAQDGIATELYQIMMLLCPRDRVQDNKCAELHFKFFRECDYCSFDISMFLSGHIFRFALNSKFEAIAGPKARVFAQLFNPFMYRRQMFHFREHATVKEEFLSPTFVRVGFITEHNVHCLLPCLEASPYIAKKRRAFGPPLQPDERAGQARQ